MEIESPVYPLINFTSIIFNPVKYFICPLLLPVGTNIVIYLPRLLAQHLTNHVSQ